MYQVAVRHGDLREEDDKDWPFPELNDDSLEMAVRRGDLREEDDKDWPFPELNGDSFEIAVRRGDFQSEEESWTEACTIAFSEGEGEPMPMCGGGASGEQDLWELKKRSERLIKKYGVKEFDFTFRPSKRHIDSYEGGSTMMMTMTILVMMFIMMLATTVIMLMMTIITVPQEWGGAKDPPAPSLRGPWDKLTPEMGPRASLRLSRYTPIQARRGCRFHRQELRP